MYVMFAWFMVLWCKCMVYGSRASLDGNDLVFVTDLLAIDSVFGTKDH